MRWLVEVVTLGKTETESLHVEAESWQKALQSARTQRGEAAPMSGFSIELLDDGCRAIDPVLRLRYDVRRRPESVSSPAAGVASTERPPPVTGDTRSQRPAAKGPAPSASQAPRATSQPPRATPRSTPAPPRASQTMRPAVSAAAMSALTPPPAAAVPQALPAPPAGASRDDVGLDVPSQIIFKREHDATESLPLTYREYVFLVPPGTSEENAEALVRTQLELVLASLGRAPAGKLVNLAAFDVAFKGKPPVRPIATLMWKDWRDAPLVEFPRRPGYAARTPPPPLAAAPPPVAPVSSSPPPPPVASPQPAVRHEAVATVPPAEAAAAPTSPATLLVADAALPPAAAASATPAPAPATATATATLLPAAPAAAPTLRPAAPPAIVVPTPVIEIAASPPAREPVNVDGAILPTATAPPAPAPEGTPPVAPMRPRARSEDLIADLFESMHELHFLRDAIEGGDFCLNLAMEKIPSLAGIVHLYDIDHREFLITSTRGAEASRLLMRRHSEGDALLSAAMGRRRAMVIADAIRSDAASIDRYAVLGGARSLIIAPVMQSGRFLGAIELLNPLDGQPYTDAEGNALTYIAEQFAEFVAARGVVTDPARISSRAAG